MPGDEGTYELVLAAPADSLVVYERLGAGWSGASILSDELLCALADDVVLDTLFALGVRISLDFLALVLGLSWRGLCTYKRMCRFDNFQ